MKSFQAVINEPVASSTAEIERELAEYERQLGTDITGTPTGTPPRPPTQPPGSYYYGSYGSYGGGKSGKGSKGGKSSSKGGKSSGKGGKGGSILLFTTISLAYGQATRTSFNGMNKYPRHLTFPELEFLIRTETENDFGYMLALSEGDAALEAQAQVESTWDDAIVYEWNKALNAETSSSQKYPYLLCHSGQNMSGNDRRRALAAAIKSTQPESDSEIYLHVLYNNDDSLCVFSQLYASVAINMFSDEYIVQPVLSSLKMIEGSVDEMKEKFHDMMSEKTSPTRIDMGLCPGVDVAAKRNGMDNTGSSFEKEGDDLKGVNDIAEAITTMLLSAKSEGLADNSPTSFLPLSQEIYLTSDAFIGQTTPSRAQMWGDLLDTYLSSGICDQTYKTRLKWNGHQTNRPDLFPSQMQVVYNNTGEETDSGCALVLLLAVAANPDVCSVEVRKVDTTHNHIANFLTESEIVDVTPFVTEGIDGTNEVVAVSDTGLDIDNCYFFDKNNDAAVGTSTGPREEIDLSHRKVVQYIPLVDSGDYQFGHGTHVCGTIAGKRFDGKGAADGIAPGAKIAFIDLGFVNDPRKIYTPLDLNDLLNTGRPFAKIHSASWGNNFNGYSALTRFFDQYMFENDDFLIITAAGNGGYNRAPRNFDIPNTVGDPATAKNAIAVGAQDSWGSSLSSRAYGPGFVTYFSSRGPSADGRMKPDIMAPGYWVLSAGAQPDEKGECDSDPLPDLVNRRRGGLAYYAGTSMSAPVVSASAAKIRQWFRDGYYPSGIKNSDHAIPNPSGALIKAVLMNGAQPLLGIANVAAGGGITRTKPYDNNQGFGRLSLQDSVYLHGNTNIQLKVWDRESVANGGTNKYDVTIDKSKGCQAEDLSVTIVWMEPGSAVGCMKCLLNDLDLSVSFGGKTHYPNGRRSPDRKNNVERVIITGVQHGETATISVNAHNLMEASQIYALVATACFGGVANLLEGENAFALQSAAPSTSPAPSTSLSPSASSAPSSAPSTSLSPSASSAPSSSSAPSTSLSPSASSAPSSAPSTSLSPSASSAPSTSLSPSAGKSGKGSKGSSKGGKGGSSYGSYVSYYMH